MQVIEPVRNQARIMTDELGFVVMQVIELVRNRARKTNLEAMKANARIESYTLIIVFIWLF